MPDAATPGAGLENVVVAQSEVCWIDGQLGELLYRGYNIKDLAAKATFEEISFLLWHGHLPNADELAKLDADWKACREVPSEIFDTLRSLPLKKDHPMSILRTAASLLAHFDPDANASDPEARFRKAYRLTSQFATIVAAIARLREDKDPIAPNPNLSHAANFLYMLTGNEPDEMSARTMDVALILHAEHGFNASTFTGRVVAATLSDIYSATVAAIGALKGPLHGGANTAVMEMLIEIGELSKVESAITAKLANKEKIMGMGHRVYKTMDPRATILEDLSKQMGERIGNTKWLEMSEKIWRTVNQQKGLWPNVDFFSASTYYTMGIDPQLNTLIFAVSRVTGWTAHIIEQLTHNRLIRPRAEYTGPKDLAFVEIEDRP